MEGKYYFPPVSENQHGLLSLVLFVTGFLMFSWLFVYQVTNPKRSLFKEVSLAIVVSLLWGFAALFGLLWAGLYV